MSVFNVTAGRVLMTTTLPSPAYAQNGLIYDTNGATYVADSASVVSWSNGFAMGSGGALLIYDASQGMPVGTVYLSGLPRYNNRLCVDLLGTGGVVSGGVPFTGSGAVAAGGSGLTSGSGAGSLTTSFYAPLQTSLVPLTAAGSGVPTFTRATPAYVSDHDGVLRQAVSGEARFSGARRVQNWIGNSENLLSAFWVNPTGGTVTVTAGQGDPLGGSTAFKLAGDGGGQCWWIGGVSVGISPNRKTMLGSIWLRAEAPIPLAGGVWLKSYDFASGEQVLNQQIAIGTTWQRFSASMVGANAASLNTGFGVRLEGNTVYAWRPQWEDISGASNPAPSEYVSVGVLAAPWHGAGVDGVRYFSTANPNSVSGNVVTTNPAGGTAIPDATLLGYLVEGQRTNICFQSQTMTDVAWVLASATVLADQYAAPDGTMTADKVTASAASNFHAIHQYPGVTSGTYTISVYAKYISNPWICIRLYDTSPYFASFNVQTGTLGAVTAGATSTITAVGNGWYRLTISATVVTTAINLLFALNNSNFAGLETWTPVGTEAVALWGAQMELAAPFTSSYIPTTTAAATRNADRLEYPLAGNISNVTGSAYCEMVPMSNLWSAPRIIADNTDGVYVLGASATNLSYADGVTVALFNGVVEGALNKFGVRYPSSTNKAQLYISGVADTEKTFDNDFGLTGVLQINGMGTHQAFGTIRNVRIYAAALSDAQLVEKTTP